MVGVDLVAAPGGEACRSCNRVCQRHQCDAHRPNQGWPDVGPLRPRQCRNRHTLGQRTDRLHSPARPGRERLRRPRAPTTAASTAGTRLVSRGRTSSTVRTHRPRDQRRAVRLVEPFDEAAPVAPQARDHPTAGPTPRLPSRRHRLRNPSPPAHPSGQARDQHESRPRSRRSGGQRHGEKAHRYVDISGAPSSPAARATVNRTMTPTVCRKQRPAVTAFGEFGSVPENLPERAWIVLIGAFGLPRELAAACADA